MPPGELTLLLDRRLHALRTARPELASAIDLQELLIRATLESARAPRAEAFPLPRERLIGKVRQGVPLLHDEPATVDVHYAADLFSRLVNALLDQQPADADLQTRLGPLVAAATSGGLDPERLFAEAFVQHHSHLAELAVQAGLDHDLLWTLASRAVAPLLSAYAEHLLPLVERIDDGSPDGATWDRGYCPVCGAWPLLSELRGIELAAYLRCSACGCGWRSRRMFCPYCGTDDFRQLRSLQVEGEQRFRISVCERCKGYLKVGNAFDPPPAELVPLDDLASVQLDVTAIERGYQRPAGTGFALELTVPTAEWAEELA